MMAPASHVQYEYDKAGNRKKMIVDGKTTTYDYNAANEMTRAGNNKYIYDANGNMVEKNSDQGTVKYDYTEDNLLKDVYYSDGQEVNYQYDALGRKVYRTATAYDLNYLQNHVNNGRSNGSGRLNAINNGNGAKVGLHNQLDGALSTDTTYYMYNGTSSDVMKEYGPEGQPMAEYYWANGQVNARKMFGFHGQKTYGWPGNIRTRGGLLYYNYDASGNAIGVDDRVGDTVMNYRYDAFGNLFTDMPAPYNATGFTGKTYDPVAGLMDYSARWYSPTVGRFLTEDSYMGNLNNPQSLNRYSYVMNNPVNMVDPSGHVPVPSWVRNQEDITIPYDQGGTSYFDNWNYVEGSYQKQTSPTVLVDTTYTNKFIQQTYQQMVTESWQYNYSKWFLFDDLILKRLPQYDYTKTFSEVSFLQWDHIITAKELMEQNADEIASYGAPPNAHVVSSYSTLDKHSLTSDMIYGGKHEAQQYNKMLQKLKEHTEPDLWSSRGKQIGNVVYSIYPSDELSLGISDGAINMWDGLKYMANHPVIAMYNLARLGSNYPEDRVYQKQVVDSIYESAKDYINNNSPKRVAGRGIFELGTFVFELVKPIEAVSIVSKASKAAEVGEVPTDVAKNMPKLTKPTAGDNIGVDLRPKSNSNALAKYDVKFATSNLIRNGKISVDDLKSMIPKNTPNTFRPSETIKEGYKYKFEVNGQKVEIKWHSPDLNAKQLYPNSNSGNMWTAQVKIDKKLLGQDGNLYKKPNNLTHIPIQ